MASHPRGHHLWQPEITGRIGSALPISGLLRSAARCGSPPTWVFDPRRAAGRSPFKIGGIAGLRRIIRDTYGARPAEVIMPLGPFVLQGDQGMTHKVETVQEVGDDRMPHLAIPVAEPNQRYQVTT